MILFWGDNKEGFFICTLLYRTRIKIGSVAKFEKK